jgi:hypothetical protein
MHLHQFQMSYIAAEDRIMLRVSFHDEHQALHELRAWLTRRMVSRVWPTILQSLQTQVTLDQPAAAHAKLEMVNMAHQASVSDMTAAGKFNTPYETEIDRFPLGETPIVVTHAHFNVKRNEPLRINFLPEAGPGFEIAFQPGLLHGFCKLLQNVVEQAEWDMDLSMPGETVAPAAAHLLN